MHFSVDKRFLKGSLLLLSGLLTALFFQIFSLAFFLLLLLIFHMNFFRDPRPNSARANEILSPSEGTIVDITEVSETRYLGGTAVKIGVFLSIFDVHVIRSPMAGNLEYMKYEPGKFFNAMKPEAARENECLWMGIRNGHTKMLVRAISGAIARRICWDVAAKQHVTQGQKLGIICYGSRTEIYLPKEAVALKIQLGQKVKVGQTILGEWVG